MMWNDWGWMWVVGALHMILFWAVLILLIVGLVKWVSGPAGRGGDGRALEILKERYARGEIGKDEFEQRKRDLLA